MQYALLRWQAEPRGSARVGWNGRRLQRYAGTIVVLAMTAAEGAWHASSVWMFVASALILALAVRAIARVFRRARDADPVVIIDERGIFDRRIMWRPVSWWEIDYVFPINIEKGRVLEFRLRHGDVAWSRCGRLLQAIDRPLRRLGFPDVCVSFFLLDGTMTQVCRAIAVHRPDLLPLQQRRAERGLI